MTARRELMQYDRKTTASIPIKSITITVRMSCLNLLHSNRTNVGGNLCVALFKNPARNTIAYDENRDKRYHPGKPPPKEDNQ